MIYTTGTIAISGSTLTGTGTNFTASGSLIRVGCTVIAMSNPVQVFQITAVGSATSLSVTPAASPALAAGTKFAILLSDSLSVDGLAQDIAETFTLYQKNISGFADVMNGSADVTITINGVAVTVPGQQSLAKKGANKDITSLSGLTTALSVAQGGTGRTDGTLEAKASSEDLLRLQPLNDTNSWIVLRDFAGNARWRLGRSAADSSFKLTAFGNSSAGEVLSINNTTGDISSTKNISTAGVMSCTTSVIEKSNYPALRWLARYTDGTTIPDTVIGKFNLLEVSMPTTSTVSNINLMRRNGNNEAASQINIKFPDTAGTLALQGTSGIDYKHDVTDADYSEAIARTDSLRLVNFVYNDDEQNRVRFGIIAEEAELTAPQYIKHNVEQYEDILANEGEKIGAK